MRKRVRRSSLEDLVLWDLALAWDPVLDPVWDRDLVLE